jgi:SAM-dependent methyltransferase
MKEKLKTFLKILGLYHPLQSFYRNCILFWLKSYYRLTYYSHKGKGFICNFCGSSYQKFVPEYPEKEIKTAINTNEVIAGYGENVYCPNCLSKNRERLVLAVLQNFIPIENKKILHFSPEKHVYNYLKNKATVITVDIMPGFYKNIDSAILHADATNLRFPDNSFDVIIANHIFEHISQDLLAMKEIYRVLKNDGAAILQVPYSEKLETTIEEPFINDPDEQERLFGQKDHVRIYALKDYVNRLKTAGFKADVIGEERLGRFKFHAIQDKECVILCSK